MGSRTECAFRFFEPEVIQVQPAGVALYKASKSATMPMPRVMQEYGAFKFPSLSALFSLWI
ncbi:MAG: hypothetical protein FWC60_12700, partial [Firmicutes bacterium]|nr:hypothetical protein [Bacillota bacterium]